MVGARTVRSFAEIDDMPRDLRECVHEFGYPIVHACREAGVTSPNRIRQLVTEIWDGARNESNRAGARNTIDWLLSREVRSYATLVRVLEAHNLAIVSMSPTRAMLDASLKEVSGFNVRCTRQEKHRRRLEAAIRAAMEEAKQFGKQRST